MMCGLNKAAKQDFEAAEADLAESLRCYEQVQFQDELAWAHVGMAHALIGLGEERAAIEYLRRGLGFAVESHSYVPLVFGLPAATLIQASRGELLRAVETCACTRQLPLAAASVLLDDLAFNLIGGLAAIMDAEAVAGAQTRGRATDPWAMAAALLDEIAGD